MQTGVPVLNVPFTKAVCVPLLTVALKQYIITLSSRLDSWTVTVLDTDVLPWLVNVKFLQFPPGPY